MKATKIAQLNTRNFVKVSDELELQIRNGNFIEQKWHCNTFPGSWIYGIGENRVEIRIVSKEAFSHEAILL